MARKYINSVETAKLIRKDLKVFKADYPEVKFSVNKEGRIRWVDGPTTKEVQDVIGKYQGASFDGMTDLKSYITHVDEDGNEIHYGIDYLFLNRSYSVEFLNMAIERADVHAYLNGEKVEPEYTIAEPSKYSGASIKPNKRYFATCNGSTYWDEWDAKIMKWADENSKTNDQDAIDRAEREQWEKEYEQEQVWNQALEEAQSKLESKEQEVVEKAEMVIEQMEAETEEPATGEPKVESTDLALGDTFKMYNDEYTIYSVKDEPITAMATYYRFYLIKKGSKYLRTVLTCSRENFVIEAFDINKLDVTVDEITQQDDRIKQEPEISEYEEMLKAAGWID